MNLLSLILALALIGFVLYLINVYVPMQSTIKNILNIVVVIFVLLLLLQALGLMPALGELRLR